MKKIIICLFLVFSTSLFATEEKGIKSVLTRAHQRLHQIWTEGSTDLYLTGYAWHNRYTYSPERLRNYNEAAWGGGIGKGLFNEKGDWHGLYAIAFLDSHRDIEPAAGYCFLKVAKLGTYLRAGLGYSVLITARADTNNGIPFPGVLPWGSVFYKKVAISAAYIPGSMGAGNVLFIVGKYSF